MEILFNALIACILGLVIGSFLNVVIYRLPLSINSNTNINLHHPGRSFCPHCKQTLRILELIPIVSFLWQKGKCTHCQATISWQYPLIEIASALISVLIVLFFGLTIEAGLYLLLAYFLIPLFIIDAQQQLLPDLLTLTLLWIGLIYQMQFGNLPAGVIGAILGYLSLWIVYWIFKLLRHKEGMGYGDFKLTAALCAWLGWQQLPYLLTLASLLSILYFLLLTKRNSTQAFAFGPFLIIAFTALQLFLKY
ncbi:MAG: prepilin peptidase [Gammaproteobacteria bacterium]|nr:prepilin peptidase [Gammaproteobacteria bacterium]